MPRLRLREVPAEEVLDKGTVLLDLLKALWNLVNHRFEVVGKVETPLQQPHSLLLELCSKLFSELYKSIKKFKKVKKILALLSDFCKFLPCPP